MAETKRFDHFELDCNDTTILRFTTGDLSGGAMLSELQDQLMDFVRENPSSKIVVDFSGLSWCPSLLINCLLRAKKALKPGDGDVNLCCMSVDVLQAFQVMNLERVFEIFDSVEEAKAAFQS